MLLYRCYVQLQNYSMLIKYWKYLLLILGFALLANGLVFNYLNWSNAFYGVFTGPVLVLISLILILKKGDNKVSPRLVSSRVTVIYLYVLPYLLVGLLMASTSLIFIDNPHQDLFIGLSIFLAILTTFSWIIARTVWEVRMDDHYFYFRRYNKKVTRRVEELVRVFEDLNGLMYRIDYEEKGFYFIPDFFERLQNPFGVPNSVQEIKNRKAVHNPKN